MADLRSPLEVPEALRAIPSCEDPRQLTEWEFAVSDYLSPHHALFTSFERYFEYRTILFQMTRQLLPAYFSKQYDTVLEVGCGFGFHLLMMRPYAKRHIGVDIPGKYEGYVQADFQSSIEQADYLLNKSFGFGVELLGAYPDQLGMLADDSIDFMFSWCLLEHIPELAASAREWRRVLKPGGIMFHVVPTVLNAVESLLRTNLVEEPVTMNIRRLLSGVPVPGTLVAPECHSEYISSFSQQFDVYTGDSYAKHFLRNGFTLEANVMIRDFENAMVFCKI
ncbi:hypothetical protein KL86DPRO_70070 [uncultured delta proteobacterium]|uniref:Methyltransferase type 11 domain-containing protein n=1 Tax=uncultured delta proteobacterium TaxID=34034 RepID=A0A212KGX7_9DELT|nr:hypothetical protein KL86DPRO_70070 [uncultured delta proteobacterium]